MISKGVLLGLVLLAACDKEKEDTGEAPPVDTIGDTSFQCVGGTPPVVSEVSLENTGMAVYEADQEYPTLTVWADVSDEDNDINAYKLDVYYDAVVDSQVEADEDRNFSSSGTLSSTECGAPSGTVGLKIFLAGGGVEYNTLYEWGAMVTDANGYVSEMAVTSGYTPTSRR